MNILETKQRLLEILKTRSYREGTVTLASGKTSDFYVDCKQTTLHAEGAFLVGKTFYNMIRSTSINIEAVGGVTMGGDPLVTSVSIISHMENDPLDALIIRKEPKGHGTKSCVEGANKLEQGSKIAILEDVITTGGSTLKAISRCKEAGLQVEAVFVLVDRMEGGKEAIEKVGCPVYSAFTKSDFPRVN